MKLLFFVECKVKMKIFYDERQNLFDISILCGKEFSLNCSVPIFY